MASTGETSRRPELDGVRGIAILLVLVGHGAAPYGFGALAAAGVTLFFVLSGYLITGILLAERQSTGRVDLVRFYGRRLTRLGPPLAVMLLVTAPLLEPGWLGFLAAGTWTSNYANMLGVGVLGWGHLWSLAVEEQFYLVWPVLLLWLVRQRPVAGLGLVVALLVAWWVWLMLAGHVYYAYIAPETCAIGLFAGCLAALTRESYRPLAALMAIVGLVGLSLIVALEADWAWPLLPIAVVPFAAVAVAGARGLPWLAWRPLSACGVASYSLYLWHEPISQAMTGDLTPIGVIAGTLTGVVAWRLVEHPLMSWRRRRSGSAALGGAKDPDPIQRDVVRGRRSVLGGSPHSQ